MSLIDYLPTHLPESETVPFRRVSPVGGEFSITALLPSLEDILDWQEGLCNFDYGYYRFVDHPALSRIQKGLQAYYDVRYCLCYTSVTTAVMEVLDYLLLSKPQMTLKVICDEEESKILPAYSLSGLQTTIVKAAATQIDLLTPLSTARDEILLIILKDAESFVAKHLEWFKEIKKLRIPVIVCSDQLPAQEWPVSLITYWVCSLAPSASPIDGGVVLSNADRQMNELKESRKQRGPILSARNAHALTEETLPSSGTPNA